MNKNMPTFDVIVVDDDPPSIDNAKVLLERLGHRVATAFSCELALDLCECRKFDVAYIDYDMKPQNGLETGRLLRQKLPGIVLFILSQYHEDEYIIGALESGFNDYIVKSGLSEDRLKISLLKAQKVIADAKVEAELRSQYQCSLSPHVKIVGSSKSMQEVTGLASRVAQADCGVLLTGESGTGKEVLARHIHFASNRSAQPFVAINCAQLPENLVESELFGHERGSFTGASSTKLGRFELADKGTILLDEICELALPLQAKLLRVLQEKTIDRVGGSRPITVDFRVIAATNQQIEQKVSEGLFRSDLFFRLNVMRIAVPPLRERRQDIPSLSAYFLEMYNTREQRKVRRISSDASQILMNYIWPGNVRELENAIYHALVMCDGEEILLEHLPSTVVRQSTVGGNDWCPEGVDEKEAGEAFGYLDLCEKIASTEGKVTFQDLATAWSITKPAAIQRIQGVKKAIRALLTWPHHLSRWTSARESVNSWKRSVPD